MSLCLQVLHCCVSSSNLHNQQSHYLLSLSDLATDHDLILGQVKSFEPPPTQTTVTEFGNLLTVAEGKLSLPLLLTDAFRYDGFVGGTVCANVPVRMDVYP